MEGRLSDNDQPGAKFVARQDVCFGNQIAFVAGEPMTLWKVEPYPVTPGHKYVVYSPRLEKYISLSDREIVPFHATPAPTQAFPYPQYPYPAAMPAGNKSPVVVLAVVSAVLFLSVLGIALSIGIGTHRSIRSGSQARTCKANLSTIDGAMMVYNAQYEAYPPSGEVGDLLVPMWLKSTPTCPTSGKPYTIQTLVPGEPPTVTCPTGEPGHSIYNAY
jgi:hypothetical protein